MTDLDAGEGRIARNAVALTGLQIVNLFLPLITLPYLFRVLGPEQFGWLAFSQGVVTYAVVLADFGFNLSATQKIARLQGRRKDIARELWATLSAQALLAVVGVLLIVGATALVPSLRAGGPVMLATIPLVVGTVVFPQWLFQGLERMGVVAVCLILVRAASIPLLFTLVEVPDDAWLAALIQSSVTTAAGMLAWSFIVSRGLVGWSRPTWARVREALADSRDLFLSSAAINLYTATVPVLLGLLTNHAQVGLFSAADRIRIAAQSVVAAFSTAAFPRVSVLLDQDRGAGLQLVRRVLWFQGGATLALSCVLFFAAPQLVLLLMGQSFFGSIPILRVLAALPFVIGLSNVLGIQTMLPLGMKRSFVRIVLVSGLVNIALLLVLAPVCQAEGAAWAMLLTELLVVLIMAAVLRRRQIDLFVRRSTRSLE